MRPSNSGNKSNPVAKNLRKFNKAVTHVDRKKAASCGYVKHAKARTE